MNEVSTAELIGHAESVVQRHTTEGPLRDRVFGSLGAALVSDRGDIFRGVSIDTGSGTGFCAEHAAIAAMVTAGQYRIAKIVAVWRDRHGVLHVVPPCGRCREFIRQIDPDNIGAHVVLGADEEVSLRELLPRHEWPSANE